MRRAAASHLPVGTGWRRRSYLRTDLSFVVRAGGSVGHIAGVLNELARQVGPPQSC